MRRALLKEEFPCFDAWFRYCALLLSKMDAKVDDNVSIDAATEINSSNVANVDVSVGIIAAVVVNEVVVSAGIVAD